jgi:hypothetical protein
MPPAAPRGCQAPNCPARVIYRSRCQIHQSGPNEFKLWWDDLWHETLKQEPICRECLLANALSAPGVDEDSVLENLAVTTGLEYDWPSIVPAGEQHRRSGVGSQALLETLPVCKCPGSRPRLNAGTASRGASTATGQKSTTT